jgi:hypothetical protein
MAYINRHYVYGAIMMQNNMTLNKLDHLEKVVQEAPDLIAPFLGALQLPPSENFESENFEKALNDLSTRFLMDNAPARGLAEIPEPVLSDLRMMHGLLLDADSTGLTPENVGETILEVIQTYKNKQYYAPLLAQYKTVKANEDIPVADDMLKPLEYLESLGSLFVPKKNFPEKLNDVYRSFDLPESVGLSLGENQTIQGLRDALCYYDGLCKDLELSEPQELELMGHAVALSSYIQLPQVFLKVSAKKLKNAENQYHNSREMNPQKGWVKRAAENVVKNVVQDVVQGIAQPVKGSDIGSSFESFLTSVEAYGVEKGRKAGTAISKMRRMKPPSGQDSEIAQWAASQPDQANLCAKDFSRKVANVQHFIGGVKREVAEQVGKAKQKMRSQSQSRRPLGELQQQGRRQAVAAKLAAKKGGAKRRPHVRAGALPVLPSVVNSGPSRSGPNQSSD